MTVITHADFVSLRHQLPREALLRLVQRIEHGCRALLPVAVESYSMHSPDGGGYDVATQAEEVALRVIRACVEVRATDDDAERGRALDLLALHLSVAERDAAIEVAVAAQDADGDPKVDEAIDAAVAEKEKERHSKLGALSGLARRLAWRDDFHYPGLYKEILRCVRSGESPNVSVLCERYGVPKRTMYERITQVRNEEISGGNVK